MPDFQAVMSSIDVLHVLHVLGISFLVWAGVSAVLWPATWLFYLAFTHIDGRAAVRDRVTGKLITYNLERGPYMVARGLVFIGVVLDFLLNWWFLSVATLDWRMELLTTHHLGHLIGRTDWRGRFARYICKDWLDAWDWRGSHCHKL